MIKTLLDLINDSGSENMIPVRPLNCQGCCFPCCLQYLEVQSPRGHVIGDRDFIHKNKNEAPWVGTDKFYRKGASGKIFLCLI